MEINPTATLAGPMDDFSFGGWFIITNTEDKVGLFSFGSATEKPHVHEMRCSDEQLDMFSDEVWWEGGSNTCTHNTWVHGFHTYSGDLDQGGDSISRLYSDGSLRNTHTDSANSNYPNEFQIGGARRANLIEMDGRMDEVFFFNRRLLESEIQDLMTGGVGCNGLVLAGAVLYFNFDTMPGNEFVDKINGEVTLPN